MPNNFDLIQGFKDFRDLAICMSKNSVCCHKADCFVEVPPERVEEECRRCWLDFLTDNKGLDLSYLDEE